MTTNTLLTISMITAKAARILSNSLQLTKRVNRSYDDDFMVKGAQIGTTVNVRKPPRYDVRNGEVVDIQASTETYAPLTFAVPVGVDIAFTSTERSFSIDDYETRFLKPAIVRVANEIDYRGYQLMPQVYNWAGTPGTALTTSTARDAVLSGIAKLYDNDMPVETMDVSEFNNPSFNATLSGSNATVFNPQAEIGEIYVRGFQGDFGGAKHFMAQQVLSHTVGTYGGTPKANSATPQVGSSIITDGWTITTTTLNVGDIITFSGSYAVNPQTKQVLSYLQSFVVTEKTVTDGSGNSTIKVSPSVVDSGPFQNVSQAIADEADIVVVSGASTSAHQQALQLHRDAFMLANKELELPPNVEASYVTDEESKIGMRIATQWDVRSNQLITRVDCMVAWAVLYPQLANRLFTS